MLRLIRKAGCLVSALISIAGFLVLLFLFLLFFISPIAHWGIEKYSPDFTGRQVMLRDIHIGLLNGKVTVEGLRMMEPNQADTFVYAGDMTVRLSLRKALSGDYRVDTIGIDTLVAHIAQHGDHFNFDDLLAKFLAPDTSAHPASTDTVHYSTGKISVRNIRLFYNNKYPSTQLALSDGDLLIQRLAWNEPLIKLTTSAKIGQKGFVTAVMEYNQLTADYGLKIKADTVSTAPLFPYLAEFLNATRADGLFTVKMEIKGNSNTPTAIAMRGDVAFDQFVLTDSEEEKQLGWKSFSIEIDSVNTASNLYRFNNVLLKEPYLLVTLTRKGNNLTDLMRQPTQQVGQSAKLAGAEGTMMEYANPFIMMAAMIGQIAEQYSKNEYGMKKFAIENGTIVYNDFLTNEQFSVLFQNFNAQTASFNDASQSVKFDINTLMNRYGNVTAHLAVDNKNYRDFDLKLAINSLTMSIFNPYTRYYVAHPFWRGDISFTNTLSVKAGKLNSNNRLIIKQIKVGDKIKSDSAINIPVKLAVAILRDRHGNIDLEIPIDGSLNDPNYRWGRAVLKVIGNLLVKAVTAPWDFLSKTFGGNPDDLKMIEFDPLQDSVTRAQRQNLDAIGKVLKEKPDLILKLLFRNNLSLERDEIAVRKALLKWNHDLQQSSDSSVRVAAAKLNLSDLSVNDTRFQSWLTFSTGITSPAIALPEKCMKVIGGIPIADAEIARINQARDITVRQYLMTRFQIPDDAIQITHSTDEGQNRNTPRPTYDATFDTR